MLRQNVDAVFVRASVISTWSLRNRLIVRNIKLEEFGTPRPYSAVFPSRRCRGFGILTTAEGKRIDGFRVLGTSLAQLGELSSRQAFALDRNCPYGGRQERQHNEEDSESPVGCGHPIGHGGRLAEHPSVWGRCG